MSLVERLQAALAGRYRIERELGRGGMGLVFLAEDLKHDRKVALKVLRPELTQSLGVDRFLREIRISAKLSHPNILTLIDSGSAGDFMYYVLPFVEGDSLRDRIDRERHLSIEDAISIIREVADALAYAHSMGVVHRDIKPENILFEAGHAVVADFGIAHAVSEAGGEKLTQSGLAIGTPAYMSPEQALAEGPVDARTDIYSLACVLYEMLAGAPPFSGPSAQAIIARKTLEPVPGLRVVRDTVPPELEAAIMRALAKVPADRYATARDFAAALLGGDGTVPAPTGEKGVRPRLVAAASVIVVVAAASYILLAVAGGGSSPGVAVASFTRLTADPGVELFPSVSPDGDWIVYAGETAGNRDIYLKRVEGETTINLTADSPADDDQPVFSPDGERIAFRSERDGGGIFVMGRTGEAVRRVTRTGFNPTWSPDGTYLAFASERIELNPQNSEGAKGLWVVQVQTGEVRQLSSEDMALPSWSPNGHRIAYTKRLGDPDPAQADVWTVSAEGGEAVAVTRGVATDWNAAWSPDGQYLYFASNRGGSMNLWRVRIDERSGATLRTPEPVTTPATSLAHISVSRDGRHIVYSSVLVTSNIQSVTLNPRTATVVGEPVWVTTGSRRWSSPDPSSDGKSVVFYSLTEPEGDIYVARANGAGLRRVTGDSAIDRMPRWSPDGEWIAFFSNRGGGLQLWMIRPDGSDLRQLTDGRAGVAAWSPDGSRIAVGALGSGTYILDPSQPWAEQTPVALPVPDSSLAGFRPDSWSPDGQWLVGDIRYLDDGIVVYSHRSQTYERLTDFGQWPVWLPDSRRVLFVSGGSGFYVVDRESKTVRQIYSVTKDVVGPPRPTRDGGTVYYSRRVTEADVWMVTLQ
ncbi:MAG: protein kinase [Gemmatimonadota bacterium]|nr:protein kinase [Gemmatimonadota bacterium]MDH3368445.1 protein kinase [Gemmatimonadota bacterium]MDH3569673.1 protein kinase [Gemmatimonadota bacterium]MDH5549523.1 protein kinase [Gemmatimonadota bacterium]